MTDDGAPNAEEAASAVELLEHIEKRRQEQIEQVTLHDCEQIRDAGEYVR